jgi:predicted DNA binding CopG/RHH family protein
MGQCLYFLILIVSLPEMKSTALSRSDFSVWGELASASRPFDSLKETKESASLVLDFGDPGESFMRRKLKTKDLNEPHGKLTAIADFLPPPELLLPTDEAIKITIALDSKTLKFFKEYADKAGLKYQRIIREVLKGYARKYG